VWIDPAYERIFCRVKERLKSMRRGVGPPMDVHVCYLLTWNHEEVKTRGAQSSILLKMFNI
jgi:hypothetical protein